MRNAWFDSGYIFCVSSRMASWTNFSHFLREGGTLEAALVVNNGSGMHSSGFAGKSAPRAVFPMIAARSACTRREVCTVDASVEQFHLEFWALFL